VLLGKYFHRQKSAISILKIGGVVKKIKNISMLICMLFIASMIFLGCGAVQRNNLKKQYYHTWPRYIQEAVDKGQVVIGMNKLQVQISTGVSENLIQKRTYVSEYGATESWTLWRFMGMWGYYPAGGAGKMVLIHFKNDKVDSISY